MKPRKFKITNWNNYTGYVGTIPVQNSIATVTEDHQLRVIERQALMGDFKFEEIFDEPETVIIPEHDAMQRSGNTGTNTAVDSSPAKKAGRPRNSNRR